MDNSFDKRTIEFVLNKDDGSTVYADLFFSKRENEFLNIEMNCKKQLRG
ncbi:hypothetical protein FLACOL7796_04678 [Flavobacterium collinsii]|jgi:hypothetical protein|uniref:Uncharacterized protein n=1 Tax=Flavobacterium collinsii TaxID=1114861 RepID=A0ABM8KQ54_9FLAO|nr:hypothetical protein FLACOL7796_04678 [Flavobacterium collinsii]